MTKLLKLKIILLILLLIPVVFYSYLNWYQNKDFIKDRMFIEEGTLTNEGVTIIIYDDDKSNLYGSWYVIQKKEIGVWKDIEPIKIFDWTLEGYAAINGKIVMDVNWTGYYGKLEKGKYRLVKEAGTKKEKGKFIIVEFVIE